MQTYLKTRPAWAQFFMFLGIAFGIFFCVVFLGSFVFSAITGIERTALMDDRNWDWANPNVITILRSGMLLQFLGLFLIPSLLFAYYSDPSPKQYLQLRPPFKNNYWILGILALIVCIPFADLLGVLNRNLIVSSKGLEWVQGLEQKAGKSITHLLGSQSFSNLILNLIFIAGFAGIGEELFFRGILQRILIKAFRSPWAGIIVSALLFSAFHLQFMGFLPRFFLGVLLGAIYWYSGSLWVAMLAHFFYDAFFIVVIYLNPKMLDHPEASIFENAAMLIPAALISLALVAVIVWQMKKHSSADYNAIYAGDEPESPTKNFSF